VPVGRPAASAELQPGDWPAEGRTNKQADDPFDTTQGVKRAVDAVVVAQRDTF
jgi:hypothetical protein